MYSESGEAIMKLSFWQHRPVQNVLPMVLSFLVHGGIVVAGIASVSVYHAVSRREVEQVYSPEASFVNTTDLPTGLPNADVKDTQAMQSEFDVKEAVGMSSNQGRNLAASLSGGGVGDSKDGLFGVALNGLGIGLGKGVGVGRGDKTGADNGDGSLAPFGVVKGGGGQSDSQVIFHPGNARRIVYVLDATGSMMSSFNDLQRQVCKSVRGLRPPTSFNIVFMNDRNILPMSPQLLFSTPENKRKAFDYVELFAARGGTDPLPSLQAAYALKPDLIYLLIDPTDFPDRKAVRDIVTKNSDNGKTKLNIIAFEGQVDAETTQFLKVLAESSGGVYRFITIRDLQSE